VLAALEESVRVIRVWHEVWHGMRMPKTTEEMAWRIYSTESPEMKRINAAIEELKRRTKGKKS
jgi:hypothetical protein